MSYFKIVLTILLLFSSSVSAEQDFSGAVCANISKHVHCSFSGGRQLEFDTPAFSQEHNTGYSFTGFEIVGNQCVVHKIINPCEVTCVVDMKECKKN